MKDLKQDIRNLRAIVRSLPKPRRRQFAMLALLMVIGGFAEFATVGALVPFVSALGKAPAVPSVVISGASRTAASGDGHLVIALLFCVALLGAGVLRISIAWFTSRFAMAVGKDLSIAAYRNILWQPYSYHLQTPSAEVLAVMQKIQNFSLGLVTPLLQALAAIFISILILVALFRINPMVTVASLLAIAVVYGLILSVTQPRQRRNGILISKGQSTKARLVQEGFGGIRDILINGLQDFYESRFSTVEKDMRGRIALNLFLSQAPKYVVETVLLLAGAIFVFLLVRIGGDFQTMVPIAAAFGLGMQRMLPYAQLAYRGVAQIRANAGYSADIRRFTTLVPERPDLSCVAEVGFEKAICLRDATFTFKARNKSVLQGVGLTIPKGSAVLIGGKTGSGKSTLVDVLMGLHELESGQLLVDDRSLSGLSLLKWRAQIAHVPQSVFIVEGSILENIALGVPPMEIDNARFERSLRCAELDEFVSTLPKGAETQVGERGALLSGGQRQRIGIARALYLDRPVLVLDEATNALDEETERRVLGNIQALQNGMTILLISHSPRIPGGLDLSVLVEDGNVHARTIPDSNDS